MSPAIFDTRRSASVQDNERRKSGSGFLFLNNRFKRAATTKATTENATSTPPTPTFGPVKDGYFKRSDSSRSIPSLAQAADADAETKRPMTAMPGREKPFLDNKEPVNGEKETAPALVEEKEESKASAGAPVTNGAEPAGAPAPAPEPAKAVSTVETTAADDEESSSEDEDEDEDKNETEGQHTQGAQLATRVAIVPARVPTPEAAKRVSYHEDADLHVKVREADGTLAVYSVRAAALATASRVFRDLLAKGDVPGVLELKSPADTAGGLDVLFSIAHFKFHELPTRPNVDVLYDLALAADKYAATHLLVPFMKEWVVALNRHVLMAGARNDEDKTLVLSWVFGEARWFSRVLSKAAYKSRVATDGTLLDSRGRPWKDQPISDEVIAMLAATRAEAIDRIIKAVSNPVHRLLNPSCYPGEEIRYCHAGTDDGTVEDCEQLLLGSAIMGLTKARLWPAPEPAKIKVSAVELAKAYGEVRIRRYQAPGLRLRDSSAEGAAAEDFHARCGFGHREALEKILNTPAKVGSGVVGQLLTRAKKSGAFGEDLFADLKEYLQDDGAAVEGEDLKGDPVHYKQARAKADRVVENKTPADDDDEEDDDDDTSSESDEE